MKLFKLISTIDNDKHSVKVFESSNYKLKVVEDKRFKFKRIDMNMLANRNSLVPIIYVGDEDDGFEIRIQTTSYGSLNEQRFNEFLERQQEALKYIEEIKHIIENE